MNIFKIVRRRISLSPGAAVLLALALSGIAGHAHAQRAYSPSEPQAKIARIEMMPNLPNHLEIKDWRAATVGFNKLAFDLNAKGKYLPLIWLDNSRTNFPMTSFGLPAYVGSPTTPGSEEGITCLSAVLSATLVGIDKSRGPYNWVLMSEQFYNKANGEDIVMDGFTRQSGQSFWYEIWPNMLFDGLAYYYPDVAGTNSIMRSVSDRWCAATSVLTGPDGVANFDHTAFSLTTMKPVDNGRWKEPDGAAGVSYIEYLAYARYHDPKYLKAADASQRFLATFGKNPLYEVMQPYGAYVAARMNAELGRSYDVGQQLDWSFTASSDSRLGWGVTLGKWGGYDCSGLGGSQLDFDGYAFATETYTMAGSFVPLVRYDQRYARAIGKWMLNAANSARYFYPGELPANLQDRNWNGDPTNSISFEGLFNHWKDANGNVISPYSAGDPTRLGWAPTDYCVYGTGHVGFFGGIIDKTNDPAILRLNCLKTDFFHQAAYPTYLYYNPRAAPARIVVPVGSKLSDVYDLVTHRFVKSRATGQAEIALPADSAAVLVITPSAGKTTIVGHKLLVNGTVVDFRIRQAVPGRLEAAKKTS